MLAAQAVRDWFAAHRQRLTGRGVWFQGGEPGTQPPQLFAEASLRVLIVRLSPYREVSAGITHSYLYQMAAAVEGVYVDMAFMPPEADEKIMREAGVPLLTGIGSKEPAAAFDLVAVSNSVLQELINLPALMHHSQLPLSQQKRAAAGSPLVILGGSNSYTHSILHGAVDTEGGCGLVDGILMGDGEQGEGSVYEAAMTASHYHLDNLIAFIDRNGLQISGPTESVMTLEPMRQRWESLGWDVKEVDGNDMAALVDCLDNWQPVGKPTMIIAHTTKGKGVSYMENVASWHHGVPTNEQLALALSEIDARIQTLTEKP